MQMKMVLFALCTARWNFPQKTYIELFVFAGVYVEEKSFNYLYTDGDIIVLVEWVPVYSLGFEIFDHIYIWLTHIVG